MTAVDHIFAMDNPIQSYAWGSRTAIGELMGHVVPTAKPQAEIWMGAHPKAPSKVLYEDRWQPLHQLIAQYPQDMLGNNVAKRFDNTLPYLFKVLAAGEPLSIQAHPDKHQAQDGYQRENLQGIALDAANRNYKDDQHKPECICALTTFWGLCGFRSLADMMTIIGPVWPLSYNYVLNVLTQSFNQKGFQLLFEKLMRLEVKARKVLVENIVENVQKLYDKNIAYDWIIKLNDKYPGDIGVISPLLLNIIKLEPGDAIFLPARQLHAYLDGLGVELMANSDNVLRGGLTPKYVDVDELIKILDFSPHEPDKLVCHNHGDTECIYHSPVQEFALSELTPTMDNPYKIKKRSNGPEVILCIEGTANITRIDKGDDITIEKGHSVFVPSIVNGYKIKGDARLFRAGANLRASA
jgi:mannose-6-phosphate isomerase